MILVIGVREDFTTRYFIEFLQRHNKQYLFFEARALFDGNAEINNDYFSYYEKKFYYTDFSGVLNRSAAPNLRTFDDNDNQRFVRYNSLFNSLLNYKFDNILNHNFYCISNNSKIFQINLIKSDLIKTPQSLILAGDNIKTTLNQYSKCKRHVVKSLSGIRSIAHEFETNEKIFSTNRSEHPVLFQELIVGSNIRVHIIDDFYFAVQISSTSLDYRYNNQDFKIAIFDLPQDIANDCVKIAKQLRLRFTGIDLIYDPDGGYYILEANPSPGWTYFEKEVNDTAMSTQLMKVLSV